MTVTYQPVLVLLSIGVAILGSLTALSLTSGSDDTENDSWLSSFALANGGLIMGGTIWSMHFIAMMAVDFPILVNYNLVEPSPRSASPSSPPAPASTWPARARQASGAFRSAAY
jgi:NO-binding membrane sensor protein with MHYT domain